MAQVGCPPGSECPISSAFPCACKVFQYQPRSDETKCIPCPFAKTFEFGAKSCDSRVVGAASDGYVSLYYVLIGLFFCLAAAAACIAVCLLRSRHNVLRQPGHMGCFLYVVLVGPYAALEATSLFLLVDLNNAQALDNIARVNAQITSSAAFAAFFGLNFIDKAALLEMWSHVVKLHISSGTTVMRWLHPLLKLTQKSYIRAVAVTVVSYVIGFVVLTKKYIDDSRECINRLDIPCVSSQEALKQPCQMSVDSRIGLDIHEGAWAGIVLLVFSLLTFFFKGLVFGMYVCMVLLGRFCMIYLMILQTDRGASADVSSADAGSLEVSALAGTADASHRLDSRRLQDVGRC